MGVMLVGSPGRTPFAGHFRGRSGTPAQGLAWAGRLRPSESPQAAWEAAEMASAAVLSVTPADRFSALDAAWSGLRDLDRSDISLLLMAWDPHGTVLSACGLVELRADGVPVVEPGHPLLGDPGIPVRTGYFHPETTATDWVGVPVGTKWPAGPVHPACGWRT